MNQEEEKMSEPQEPKNLILVKLDQVLERMDHMEARLYVELFQTKLRLSAVEQQVAKLHEAIVQQWANQDRYSEELRKHEEQLRKLENHQ